MRDGLLIRWRGPGEALEWLRVEDGRAGFVQHEQAPAAAVLAKAARITVLVPAEDVLSIGLDLPARKPDAARSAAAASRSAASRRGGTSTGFQRSS